MDDPTTPLEIQEFVLRHYGREALIKGGRESYAEKCELWAEVFGVETDKSRRLRRMSPQDRQREEWAKQAERVKQAAARIMAEREQAAFDRAYHARKENERWLREAERRLEREALRDEAFARPGRARAKEVTHRHLTDIPKRSSYRPTDEYEYTCFDVTLPPGAFCSDLVRSDLDMLSDHEQPLQGFRPNAHSRRRAFFSRYGRSDRSVSLARAA